MDKNMNTKKPNQKTNMQESQIHDTEGAVMPDANRQSKTPKQDEVETALNQNKKGQR